MDRYRNILEIISRLKQQLLKLELTDIQRENILDQLHDLTKTLLFISIVSQSPQSQDPLQITETTLHPLDEWITVSRAEVITGRNKGTFSRAASDGIIKSNGKKRSELRILKSSVLLYDLKLTEDKENKYNSRDFFCFRDKKRKSATDLLKFVER